jgi:hypothetical protein
VAAGSVVNEDASLGRMFETEGVKDVRSSISTALIRLILMVLQFFSVRCRASEDDIIAHIKTHSLYVELDHTCLRTC